MTTLLSVVLGRAAGRRSRSGRRRVDEEGPAIWRASFICPARARLSGRRGRADSASSISSGPAGDGPLPGLVLRASERPNEHVAGRRRGHAGHRADQLAARVRPRRGAASPSSRMRRRGPGGRVQVRVRIEVEQRRASRCRCQPRTLPSSIVHRRRAPRAAGRARARARPCPRREHRGAHCGGHRRRIATIPTSGRAALSSEVDDVDPGVTQAPGEARQAREPRGRPPGGPNAPALVGAPISPSVRAVICGAMQRRGRDSNPRYGCPHNGFRDRPIQPLSHPSSVGGER